MDSNTSDCTRDWVPTPQFTRQVFGTTTQIHMALQIKKTKIS